MDLYISEWSMIHVPWLILFWAVMFTKHRLLRFHLLCHLVWYFSLVGVLVKSSYVYRCGYVLCESLKVWIRWVRKGSWKKREVEKSEVGKNRAKLESFFWSWKVSWQLESFGWSWKVWMNLESCHWSWKVSLPSLDQSERSKRVKVDGLEPNWTVIWVKVQDDSWRSFELK